MIKLANPNFISLLGALNNAEATGVTWSLYETIKSGTEGYAKVLNHVVYWTTDNLGNKRVGLKRISD